MSVPLKARVRVAYLRRVFSSLPAETASAIARLSVLYEDLKIDAFGVAAPDIPELDSRCADARYRRLYFIRRSSVTLQEVSRALNTLAKDPWFKSFKKRVARTNPKAWSAWDKAAKFFGSEAYRTSLKEVRNSVGGHFNEAAARSAINLVAPSTTGKIELHKSTKGTGGGCRLHFAGEIAAIGSLSNVQGAATHEKAQELVKNIVMNGYRHSAEAVHALVSNLLWERFGG